MVSVTNPALWGKAEAQRDEVTSPGLQGWLQSEGWDGTWSPCSSPPLPLALWKEQSEQAWPPEASENGFCLFPRLLGLSPLLSHLIIPLKLTS